MRFRPCIDLRGGRVTQIVGGTLNDSTTSTVVNFETDRPASYFADIYRRDNFPGGHVIKLGPGNDDAAMDALHAYPGGLQLGGGVDDMNARSWIDAGASHVIVTSFVFSGGEVNHDRLKRIVSAVGKDRLVLDLSCRKRDEKYFIVTDRWQRFTDVEILPGTLEFFAGYCDEFLIHAADVEGKCSGVEEELVEKLGKWVEIPTTYAGGIRSMGDIELIRDLGKGRLDYTVGSALDLFGGSGVRYEDLVRLSRTNE